MIVVKQYNVGDKCKLPFRKFYVKDKEKIKFWKKMATLNTYSYFTKVEEVKQDGNIGQD